MGYRFGACPRARTRDMTAVLNKHRMDGIYAAREGNKIRMPNGITIRTMGKSRWEFVRAKLRAQAIARLICPRR
jgi:hypothetical protein